MNGQVLAVRRILAICRVSRSGPNIFYTALLHVIRAFPVDTLLHRPGGDHSPAARSKNAANFAQCIDPPLLGRHMMQNGDRNHNVEHARAKLDIKAVAAHHFHSPFLNKCGHFWT